MLEVVPFFSYFGCCLYSGCGCKQVIIKIYRVASVKFNELLPLPTPTFSITLRKGLHFVYEHNASCKMNLSPNLIRFARPVTQWPSNDSIDVRCHHQGPRSQELLERMQLDDLAKLLHTQGLKWLGYIERYDSCLKKVRKLIPTRSRGPDWLSEYCTFVSLNSIWYIFPDNFIL